jgi:hypothetical protein
MDADDPGLLGRLPRSRPGTRSRKRGAETLAEPPEDRADRVADDDPVGGAVRAAVGAAAAGLRAADGVAREVVRRLPRP